jgi:hypothetical protein
MAEQSHRHRWAAPFGIDECIKCHCTRRTMAVIGIRLHRHLRTYVRADGIRFTGAAPACEPRLKHLGRPVLKMRYGRAGDTFVDGPWFQYWIDK